MLNGVPLGAVGRVMRNSDINPQFLRGLDETPLELPVPCIVGAATVTEDEYALCIWIYVSEVLFPLLDKAVTGELRCVMAHAEGHVASVPACVVDAMRYHLSVGERGVVMVVHLHRLSGVGTGVTGYGKLATNKAYAMSAIPFCYNGNELPRLSLVRVFEVLHFLLCYYFCWIIRAPHNCLKYSYKGTNFLADF